VRIRFAVVSWILEKCKAAVRDVRTIKYNNLFHLLFIILYNIYNSLFNRLNRYPSPSHYYLYLHHRPPIECHLRIRPKHCLCNTSGKIWLTIMLCGMAFHAADTHRATSEGGWRKGADYNRELTFFRLRNRQKLVWIRFENIRCFFISHTIGPTDLLHLTTEAHFKIFQIFPLSEVTQRSVP